MHLNTTFGTVEIWLPTNDEPKKMHIKKHTLKKIELQRYERVKKCQNDSLKNQRSRALVFRLLLLALISLLAPILKETEFIWTIFLRFNLKLLQTFIITYGKIYTEQYCDENK